MSFLLSVSSVAVRTCFSQVFRCNVSSLFMGIDSDALKLLLPSPIRYVSWIDVCFCQLSTVVVSCTRTVRGLMQRVANLGCTQGLRPPSPSEWLSPCTRLTPYYTSDTTMGALLSIPLLGSVGSMATGLVLSCASGLIGACAGRSATALCKSCNCNSSVA